MRGHYCLDKREFITAICETPISDVTLRFRERLPLDLWKMLVNMEVTAFTLECRTCKAKIKVSWKIKKKEDAEVEKLIGSGLKEA